MQIKNFNEIKDGMVVFMPSGIQATLHKDGNNILVEYLEMYSDKYTKEQFEKIIDEGIFVFSDQPTIAQQSVLMEEKKILNKLTEKGFIRESLSKQLKENSWQMYDQSYYVIGLDGEQEGPFDSYNDAEEYIVDRTKGDEQLRADYSIISAEEFETNFEDFDEAYKQEDNEPGSVYTAQKEKPLEYLTADFKNELLTCLDKIAKEYPNVKVRQQAVTFMDELGLQEYYDTKAVKDFINKYTPILTTKVNEDLQNGLAIVAEEIEAGNKSGYESTELGNWLLNTSLDDKWESLPEDVKNYIMEKIAQPVYDGHISYTDLEIAFNNDLGFTLEALEKSNLFNEEQLQQIIDGEDEVFAYISYEISFDGKLRESFKLKKKKKKEKIEDSLNEDIYLKDEEGNEEGPFQDQEAKEEFLKTQKQHGVDKEYEEVIKEEDMKKTKNEDCYKVYNTINPEDGYVELKDWDEVDNYLNKQWGEYKGSISKENTEFGSEQDKEEFLSNFDVEIVPVTVEFEPEEELCPVCGEPVCGDCEHCKEQNSLVPTNFEEDLEEAEEVVEEPIQEKPEIEEIDSEEEVEVEDEEDNKDKETIESPEEAKEVIDNVEDAIDDIEDFIKTLLDAEEEPEPLEEMCMQKLPDPEVAKKKNKKAAEETDKKEKKNEDMENKRYIVSIQLGKDDWDEEAFECIDQAVQAFKELKPDKYSELIDAKNDEVLLSNGKLIENLKETSSDAVEFGNAIAWKLVSLCGYRKIEDITNSYVDRQELEQDFDLKEVCDDLNIPNNLCKESINYAMELIFGNNLDEDFEDGMSNMLTNINDLDFPDALQDTVDTKEDGTLYKISDLVKEIEELKGSLKSEIEDIKNDIKSALQDTKQDLKNDFNNVENKVQDTKTAVDDLTVEEDELEEEPIEEPTEETEETPAEEPTEETEAEEPAEDEETENVEESYNEKALKGNPIYEAMKEVIRTNKQPNKIISVPTIATKLREDYGINTKSPATYQVVSNLATNVKSFREYIVDANKEAEILKESSLGKAAKWLSGGLLAKLADKKKRIIDEEITAVKREIDRLAQQGEDAQTIKDAIVLQADNEQEEDEGVKYATQKLQQRDAKTEELKKTLLKTSSTARLNNLF